MAKKEKQAKEWEDIHQKRIGKYTKQIEDAFSSLYIETGLIGASAINFNKKKPFFFSKYPKIKERIDKLLSDLIVSIALVIENGTSHEWTLANQKNNEIVQSLFKNINSKKIEGLKKKFNQRNIDALNAFQKRKVGGISLSERIWNLTKQTSQELEMSIDLGLLDGKSASQMSRDVRMYLNNPDKLFRRVKDERGMLHLSKNADAYHPGQGVYRSSKANAMRLTRTETNMAYRLSDYERWSQLDFILGYEIKRSNNPYPCPVCEALKGKYPKTFKFSGWHPNCRCFMIPILADIDDFVGSLNSESNDNHYENEITKLPNNFTKWVGDNSQSLLTKKSAPYFIRDNSQMINLSNITRANKK